MTTAVKTMGTHESRAEIVTVGWNPLYLLGGIAAVLTVLFIPIAIYVFMKWPQPTTVDGWYTMFQNNRLIALIDMDILIVLSNAISIPITLSLYVLLRRTNESFMAIALALGLVAVATYFASNPALTMITLSNQYTGATTEANQESTQKLDQR